MRIFIFVVVFIFLLKTTLYNPLRKQNRCRYIDVVSCSNIRLLLSLPSKMYCYCHDIDFGANITPTTPHIHEKNKNIY